MKSRRYSKFTYSGKYCGGLKRGLKSDLEKANKRFEQDIISTAITDREKALSDWKTTPEIDKVQHPEVSVFIDVENFMRSALEKERLVKIIALRYGLLGYSEHTLKQTGKIFGVQQERIRQLEARAMRYFRKWVSKNQRKFDAEYDEFYRRENR
jgi:DNA-directed RNA polymerase sigma subunit (sigma70/sigma32)